MDCEQQRTIAARRGCRRHASSLTNNATSRVRVVAEKQPAVQVRGLVKPQTSGCKCLALTMLHHMEAHWSGPTAPPSRSAPQRRQLCQQRYEPTHSRDLVSPAVAARDSLLAEHAPPSSLYQFGVAGGASMRKLCRDLRPSATFGFDSFAGLPAEPDATERVAGWQQGSYSADPRAAFARDLPCGPAGVQWVAGFY